MTITLMFLSRCLIQQMLQTLQVLRQRWQPITSRGPVKAHLAPHMWAAVKLVHQLLRSENHLDIVVVTHARTVPEHQGACCQRSVHNACLSLYFMMRRQDGRTVEDSYALHREPSVMAECNCKIATTGPYQDSKEGATQG